MFIVVNAWRRLNTEILIGILFTLADFVLALAPASDRRRCSVSVLVRPLLFQSLHLLT